MRATMTRAVESFHPFRSAEAKVEYEAFYAERARAWPVPCETVLVDTPSARTFVRVSGCPTDPPLVLLAGARGTSLMWLPNVAALSSRYRTYALDTIGDVGLSAASRPPSSGADLVRWLDEVTTALVPGRPFSLMGMSFGGWMAAEFALALPSRLSKVVLLAPGCTVLRSSFAFYARVMLHALPLPGRARGGAMARLLRWLFEDTVRSGEAGRRLVEGEVMEMICSGRFFTLPWPPWPRVLSDDDWRRWGVPALFVVGEHEKIYSPTAAVRRLNRLAPAIRTEIVKGAGHDLPIVQADRVNRVVLEFLDGSPASGEA